MLVVLALGGNALLRRGEPPDADTQRGNARVAAIAVAEVVRDHEVVVTHGNGPQVGLLALQAEAYADVRPYPLDVLDAESEGMIGYVLQQELGNALPGHEVATILTQVVVDEDDRAFTHPTKPIGAVIDDEAARRLERERGWVFARDGDGWRRVVASPEPREIVELASIRCLLAAGIVPCCAGGGGIPVVRRRGALHGVEAVIDKDRVAALLAARLGADALVLLTDVDAVYADWHTPRQRRIEHVTPADVEASSFDPGSMGPKVEAACRFVTETGGVAGIGALTDAARILAGTSGTRIQAH